MANNTKPVIGAYGVPKRNQLTNLASGSPAAQKKETSTGSTTYEIWLSRLKATLRWRNSKYDKDWQRAYRMFNGAHWRDIEETDPSSDQVRDRITVNLTMSSVLNIVPFLSTQDPEFQCKPRKPEDVETAKLKTAILNYEFIQRLMFPQVEKTIYDNVEIGHGIIKTGYAFEIDEAVKPIDGIINYDSYIKEDAPFIKRICPFYFLIDPLASENNLETARWCAEIFFKPLRNVLANQRYDQTVLRKIKEGVYSPGTKTTVFDALGEASLNNLESNSGDNRFPESDLVVLYEVWDKGYQKYYIFADGVPEPLLEKDSPYPYIDGFFPYIKVDYIPIQDELYGVGVPFSIEDQQFELNRIRTSAFEHRRRFNRKYEVLKSVEKNEVNKLIQGEDGTIIYVNQIGSIKPIEDAGLTQDTFNTEAMVRGDFQELTGTDALIRGGQLPSRTSASEVSARTSLFRLKLDDRVKSIDRFVVKVGMQVLQHIEANYTTERFVEIVGLKGSQWKKLTFEQIKEEVDVTMETISAPKVDPQIDRQQRSFVWQTSLQALPLVQAGLLHIDFDQLYAWVMEAFDYKDIGRFFNFDLVVQQPLQQTTGEQPQQLNNLANQSQGQANNGAISQQAGIQNILSQFGGIG